MERVAEASKAIFTDLKFIHTIILLICLEHWLGVNSFVRDSTKNYGIDPTPKSWLARGTEGAWAINGEGDTSIPSPLPSHKL